MGNVYDPSREISYGRGNLSFTSIICRNFEVEVRDSLGRCVVDVSVKDCIDDTTGIFDGDTFSGAVPSCIYKISFSAVCFHLLNKLLSVFCRMKLKESLSEASGEGRCRLSDSTLCTSKFSCEARQEVVLSLLRCKNRYWRQYAESICRKEDYVLRRAAWPIRSGTRTSAMWPTPTMRPRTWARVGR